MAENKIIVNKHFREPSAITESAFSRKVSLNKYGEGKHEYFREGEIIICNDENEPGLYIATANENSGNEFNVVNITSAEHIKLYGYHEPSGDTSGVTITSSDTITEAFAKVTQLIEDAKEHSGGGAVYEAGDYIEIDSENRISVTGITPDEYLTEEDVAPAIADAKEEAVAEAYTAMTQYVDRIDPTNLTIVNSFVTSATQSFVIDGTTYEPGVYLVLVFGREGDETTYRYSYNNISDIITAGKEYMTEEQYEELIENGSVVIDGRTVVYDANVDYYTFED